MCGTDFSAYVELGISNIRTRIFFNVFVQNPLFNEPTSGDSAHRDKFE